MRLNNLPFHKLQMYLACHYKTGNQRKILLSKKWLQFILEFTNRTLQILFTPKRIKISSLGATKTSNSLFSIFCKCSETILNSFWSQFHYHFSQRQVAIDTYHKDKWQCLPLDFVSIKSYYIILVSPQVKESHFYPTRNSTHLQCITI